MPENEKVVEAEAAVVSDAITVADTVLAMLADTEALFDTDDEPVCVEQPDDVNEEIVEPVDDTLAVTDWTFVGDMDSVSETVLDTEARGVIESTEEVETEYDGGPEAVASKEDVAGFVKEKLDDNVGGTFVGDASPVAEIVLDADSRDDNVKVENPETEMDGPTDPDNLAD